MVWCWCCDAADEMIFSFCYLKCTQHAASRSLISKDVFKMAKGIKRKRGVTSASDSYTLKQLIDAYIQQ